MSCGAVTPTLAATIVYTVSTHDAKTGRSTKLGSYVVVRP